MSNEKRLATPLKYHILSLGDIAQLNLNLGQGQNVSRCGQALNESIDKRGGAVSASYTNSARHGVGEVLPGGR